MKHLLWLVGVLLMYAPNVTGATTTPILDTDRVYTDHPRQDTQQLQSFIFAYERARQSPAQFYVVFENDSRIDPDTYLQQLIREWRFNRFFDWQKHVVILVAPDHKQIRFHVGQEWQTCFHLTETVIRQQVVPVLTPNTPVRDIITQMDHWLQQQISLKADLLKNSEKQLDETNRLINQTKKDGLLFSIPPHYRRVKNSFFHTQANNCELKAIQKAAAQVDSMCYEIHRLLSDAKTDFQAAQDSLVIARSLYNKLMLRLENQAEQSPSELVFTIQTELDSLIIEAEKALRIDYQLSQEFSISAVNLIEVLQQKLDAGKTIQEKALVLSVKLQDRLSSLQQKFYQNNDMIDVEAHPMKSYEDQILILENTRTQHPHAYLKKASEIITQLDSLESSLFARMKNQPQRNRGEVVAIIFCVVLSIVILIVALRKLYIPYFNANHLLNTAYTSWSTLTEHGHSFLDLLRTDFSQYLPDENNYINRQFNGRTREKYTQALAEFSALVQKLSTADRRVEQIHEVLIKLSFWRKRQHQQAFDLLAQEEQIDASGEKVEAASSRDLSGKDTKLPQVDKLFEAMENHYHTVTTILQEIKEAENQCQKEFSGAELMLTIIRDLLDSLDNAPISTEFYKNRYHEADLKLRIAESVLKTDPLTAVKEIDVATVILRSLQENITIIPEYLDEMASHYQLIEGYRETIIHLKETGLKLNEDGGPEPLIEKAEAILRESECTMSQGRLFTARADFEKANELIQQANFMVSKTIQLKEQMKGRILELRTENERLYQAINEAMVPLTDLRAHFPTQTFSLENDNIDESIVILDRCTSLLEEAATYAQPYIQKYQTAWNILTDVEKMQAGVAQLLSNIESTRKNLYRIRRETRDRDQKIAGFFYRACQFFDNHAAILPRDLLDQKELLKDEFQNLKQTISSNDVEWINTHLALHEFENNLSFLMNLAQQSVTAHQSFLIKREATISKLRETDEILIKQNIKSAIVNSRLKLAHKIVELIRDQIQKQVKDWAELIRLLMEIEQLTDRALDDVQEPGDTLPTDVERYILEVEELSKRPPLSRQRRKKEIKSLYQEMIKAAQEADFENVFEFGIAYCYYLYREESAFRLQIRASQLRQSLWECENQRRQTLARAQSERASEIIRQGQVRTGYLFHPSLTGLNAVPPAQIESYEPEFLAGELAFGA